MYCIALYDCGSQRGCVCGKGNFAEPKFSFPVVCADGFREAVAEY